MSEQVSVERDQAAAEKSTQPRSANGRYATRVGEPDNPYGRRVAEIRWAVAETLTRADAVAIARKLIERARNGSEAAAKLVFQYTMGKPLPGSHPDWVDHDEWELRMERANGNEFALGTMERPPLEIGLTVGRAMDEKSFADTKRQFEESLAADIKRQVAAERRAAARAAREAAKREADAAGGGSPRTLEDSRAGLAPHEPANGQGAHRTDGA